jgi:hypothetical protein
LSASVPSRHTEFSVDFTTNIVESNFRYTHVKRANFAVSAPYPFFPSKDIR